MTMASSQPGIFRSGDSQRFVHAHSAVPIKWLSSINLSRYGALRLFIQESVQLEPKMFAVPNNRQ